MDCIPLIQLYFLHPIQEMAQGLLMERVFSAHETNEKTKGSGEQIAEKWPTDKGNGNMYRACCPNGRERQTGSSSGKTTSIFALWRVLILREGDGRYDAGFQRFVAIIDLGNTPYRCDPAGLALFKPKIC
jgi:hypothetical protein